MKLATEFKSIALRLALLVMLLACASNGLYAQQRRDREPNEVYAARRAKLVAQADSPVVLWGLTGREEFSQAYVFTQEDNFYYLTGHNEEHAGLIILPALKAGQSHDAWDGPREILFLPAKNPQKEKWNGVRLSPTDPDISARTAWRSTRRGSGASPSCSRRCG